MWRNILQAEVWKKLKRFGRSRGLSEENSEDYATESFICLHGGRKATFDQLLVDFKRKEFGDSRSKSFRVRESEDIAELERVGRLDLPHLGAEPCSDEVGRNDLSHGFFSTGKSGLLFELVKDNGYSAREVAEMYGVSEGRMCQLLRKPKKEFESHVLMKDLKDKLEVDPDYLELKVDWIVL